MEIIKAVFLGVVQGLTEFLPISSSGHLVIGSELLSFSEQGIAFEVFLHLGTLFSVLIVFRSELKAMAISPVLYIKGARDKKTLQDLLWCLYVIIATLPAVIVGLTIKDSIESIFANLPLVFFMLFITGCIMIASRYIQSKGRELSVLSSVLIGCAQACAILPGLSRSGSTIFTGMVLGIDREVAARFSFIMSVPAILGAVVLQVGDLAHSQVTNESLLYYFSGTLAAAISGYFAIVLLLDIVKKNRLQWFGYYCLLLSMSGFMYLLAF